MLKDKLQSDLKAAMLSGDKQRASALNMLKSAVLNQEIADGTRDTGLTDEQVIAVFTKEAKKRVEAAEMYRNAGNEEKAEAELYENAVIKAYLPEQLSEEEITSVVDEVLATLGQVGLQDMGKVIGLVKARTGATADGGRVAAVVKSKLV